MVIYLLRHAHAGNRGQWQGDDEERPLSRRGWDQAEHLVHLLGEQPVKRIYSSPSLRCVETVQPLAAHLGLEVRTRAELLEGADPDQAIAFLLGRNHTTVASSHGDLIPKVIRRLVRAGMRTTDANIAQKASVWEIHVEGGAPVAGRYHPPRSTRS